MRTLVGHKAAAEKERTASSRLALDDRQVMADYHDPRLYSRIEKLDRTAFALILHQRRKRVKLSRLHVGKLAPST